jgi:hypothetical protein
MMGLRDVDKPVGYSFFFVLFRDVISLKKKQAPLHRKKSVFALVFGRGGGFAPPNKKLTGMCTI